jgi:hypothetical protein
MRTKLIQSLSMSALLILITFLAACQPGSVPIKEQKYHGEGLANLPITWNGPAVLHILAEQGQRPFRASIVAGIGNDQLVESDSLVDEYRIYYFSGENTSQLSIQGDQSWEVTLLPLSSKQFPILNIPGEYGGNGNAVVYLEGDNGIASFNIDRTSRIEAWALAGNKVEKLIITRDGDYKGKSVLPQETTWLVVSAAGPWSVTVQEPCCELHK